MIARCFWLQILADHFGHVAARSPGFFVSGSPFQGTVARKYHLRWLHIDESGIRHPPIVQRSKRLHMANEIGPPIWDANGGWNSISCGPLHHRLQFPTITRCERWDARRCIMATCWRKPPTSVWALGNVAIPFWSNSIVIARDIGRNRS